MRARHPMLAATVPAVVLGLAGTAARADSALVAVAANFAQAAEVIAGRFAEATGHEAELTTGSTGKLYAQIVEGAPFEVLLSADAATPERLEAEGLGVAGSRFTYAVGRMVLWSADPGRIGADPAATLTAETTRHIAIANPDLAPYGAAAREALRNLGIWDAVEPRIVMGENIGQAHSMVASGAADVGFVALSAIDAPGKEAEGSRWDVPQQLFTPIRQDAVLLKAGAENPAAVAFLDFLGSDVGREVAESFGYAVD
jgi:molybdate transport system substrate-binding protein